MSKIAIPITGNTLDEFCSQISEACVAGADIIELRLDYIEELTVEKAVCAIKAGQACGRPLIVTCRVKSEGAKYDYPGELRCEILCEAVRAGVEHVDCEFLTFQKEPFRSALSSVLGENPSVRLILSCHDFDKKPDNVEWMVDDVYTLWPNAIAKIAYKANHINDCFEAFDVLNDNRDKVIVLCMGDDGLISRILASKAGGYLTFASLDGGSSTAPGQISIAEMRDLYRFDKIDLDTELFGIIAEPVGHSMSPAIHNMNFERFGMNRVYLPLLVRGGKKEFSEFMENIRSRKWLGFKGFSVTLPHKTNALEYLHDQGEFMDKLAMKIGALNTLTMKLESRVNGYNTDYAGALDALVDSMGIDRKELEGKRAAVIGAGGVSRAIVTGLCEYGVSVTIYNRTESKARNLAKQLDCHWAKLEDIKNIADDGTVMVVNCTSIGMSPNSGVSPVPSEYLNGEMVVFDTIYNPIETRLLQDAKKAGAKTVSGVEMFVGQAMEQFYLFTHQKGDAELMRETVVSRLG